MIFKGGYFVPYNHTKIARPTVGERVRGESKISVYIFLSKVKRSRKKYRSEGKQSRE
jgi:rRNA processing protein Krr1/Pno1